MRKASPLGADSHVRQGMRIWYYRELEQETPIPFEENNLIHQDQHLLVVDKPHFLPMIPTGRFLRETFTRAPQAAGSRLPHLTPIHRLDRETAGVVIFSHNLETRGTYQSMFQKRAIRKTYEALAPCAGRTRDFPFTYRSRMVDGEKFFVMKGKAGEPNSETVGGVDRAPRPAGALPPASAHGPQAPRRLHMASLGVPILNDAFYPVALPCKGDDFSKPLQLLARSIAFEDPLTGEARSFASGRALDWP